MKVLHVLEAVRGGTSRHVLDVVRHAGGVEHVVALPGGEAAASGALYDSAAVDAMRAAGARVVTVPMRRSPWSPANGAGLAALVGLIRREAPVAVHGHSAVGGALGRMAAATTARPGLYTANGVATEAAYLMAERALGRLTDRWIAVSESEAALARRERLARPERVVVVPNGIDLAPAGAEPDGGLRARLGLAPGTPLVGTVARLVPQKAPVAFVSVGAAVARTRPEAHFVLIGMGPLQPEVDRAVAGSGMGDRWHQVAHLDRAAAAIGELDVFVLPSAFEGAPYTPLEAMAAAVPVVLSDVVGNRDAVVDGVTGVLRPFGDDDGMAAAVIGLLADPARREAMGRAGRAWVEEHGDVRRMGARLAEIYAEVSGNRSRTRRLPQAISGRSRHEPDPSASQ